MHNNQFKTPNIQALLLVFFIVNVGMMIILKQGPSTDEGIYIIAGLELLNNFPDSYSSWHNGSPYIWSLLSGWIFSVTSFTVLRIFTAIIGTIILYLCYLHTLNFLGKKEARLATLMLCIFSPFLSFTQIAVYDVLAFLFFMMASVLIPKKNLKALFVAAILSGLAIITKYAFIISFPLLALYVFFIYDKKRILHLSYFCVLSGLVVIVHNLIVFESLIPASFNSYTDNSVKFGYNSLYSLGICMFILLPFIINYLFSRGKIELPRKWVWMFLGGLLLWPLFHIVTGNPVSAQKHLIYGVVFSAPLLVFNFQKALKASKTGVLLVAAFFFIFQYAVLFNSWSDLWKANQVLQEQVSEKSSIISNVGTYRTRFALFGKMPKVSEQLNNYHELSENKKEIIASADFILWKNSSNLELGAWIEKQKPFYEKIESYSDFFIGAGDHLPWGFHTIEISVYKKK